MTRASLKSILSYVGVGGLGAAGYVVLASLLSHGGMAEWLAGTVSYIVITPLAYLGQHRFTFSAAAPHKTALPRYLALQLLGFTLSWLLPLLLAGRLPAPVIFTCVAAGIAVMNYLLMKIWAFAPSEMDQKP